MEGNFYVSEVVVRRELKSKFGACTVKCPDEMRTYAKCVEAARINNVLRKDACVKERSTLMSCVNGNWQSARGR